MCIFADRDFFKDKKVTVTRKELLINAVISASMSKVTEIIRWVNALRE